MAQAKKFGTFAGVFTPSILTILGVIMYLRLGYIVGEAGLYAIMGLIIIAHVISISTGLSLSSIATDKKIKTGGIYYMLSRSLGLPMGGSIGVTLFLGTAMSIALYIVGFVENFLSIQVIVNYLGLTGGVNDIRLIGTAVIILLVVIAYISTSIAIKTQFFILGAIALSIVSIVVGVLTNTDYQAVEPALSVSENAPNLIVLFAIFFPAVTGFTAGVAMSGDLKSPKDSIPKGTLYAIGVGLLVYVGLAFLFAFFVDRQLLITDTNFLIKIAWFSPLVIGGIWGATLSSALGGILGAPRILQAMSNDKVTPKFFAFGVGNNNEPRRALILTFVLAELGILIGELDVIAGIVSMFYIAAYGFINLAYVLERWSNSDFRPSLKVSIWIGIIGFVASIFVMINLDPLAMLLAFGIMFGIYIFLKRREVQGNMTDVWQSVWTSIIRTSLNRINKKPLNESNWQPNIVLFSGDSNARPHLLELGVSIVGKQGFLSNFDLHVSEDSDFLFSKQKQKIASEVEEQHIGVFTRQQTVRNIYEGIEMIAQTYGFSGVEPNTVMMGWARQSSDPIRFTQLVTRLSALDMNVVLIDYDKRFGWGKKQSIDIWWRGGGHNGNLALSLAKFITLSDDWANAKIRLLIVNSNTDLSSSIYEDAKQVIDNLRISADVMIINNEIEQRSFYDIIQVESVNTDLTFLGFPPIVKGEEEKFVEQTNKLCHNIGTVAIIQASSEFKKLSLGEIQTTKAEEGKFSDSLEEDKPLKEILDPLKKPELEQSFKILSHDLEQLNNKLVEELVYPVFENQMKWLENLLAAGEKSFDNLISRSTNNQASTFRKTIEAQHSIFIRGQLQYITEHLSGQLDELIEQNYNSILQQTNLFAKSIDQFAYRIKVPLNQEQLSDINYDDKKLKRKVLGLKPLFLFSSEIPYYVHLREIISMYFPQLAYARMNSLVAHLNKDYNSLENEVFKCLQRVSGIFSTTIEISHKSIPSEKELLELKAQISEIVHVVLNHRKVAIQRIINELKNNFRQNINGLIETLNHPLSNSFIDYNMDTDSLLSVQKRALAQTVNIWSDNQHLIENVNILNTQLIGFRFNTQLVLKNLNSNLNESVKYNLQKPIREFVSVLQLAKNKDPDSQKSFISNRLKTFQVNLDLRLQQTFLDLYNNGIKKIKNNVSEFPELLSIYSENLNSVEYENEIQTYQKLEVAIKRTLDYMVEKEMMEVREILINTGQELNALNTQFSELVQLVLFPSDSNETTKEDYKKLIDSKLEYDEQLILAYDKANGLLSEIQEKEEFILGLLQKKISGLKANLELYPFIRSIQDLKNYIKTENTKRWFGRLMAGQKNVSQFITHQLNKLWYNQSSGLLLAQKLSKSLIEQETRVDTLLAFKDEVSPAERVLKKIPDYYKQLFLRKQFYLNEFWVEREEESKSFMNNYRHWENGFGGGILILGERNSGKSFFSNQLIKEMDTKGESYSINPPYTGSVNVEDLLRSFQSATEIQGSFAKIFTDIPPKSVFFMDDLELWWEKSPQGMLVVDQLMSIINRFGQQHLFVVISNIHSFRLINKYRKIESNFLGLVELLPFNARQLKDVIMYRHTSSSMTFNMNNIPESRYRSWNYARLFSRLFNYSEGNPGVVLQAWVKSIEDVDKTVIKMKKAKIPDTSSLRYLETEWMIFILQFLLHKRMNLAKLIRVSQDSRAEVIKKVRILKRAGVVIQLGEDILDLNPFMLPFLRRALTKRELI